LSKPFEQKDLQRIMQKWIGERKTVAPKVNKQEKTFVPEPEKPTSMSSELYDLTLLNQLALNDEEFIAKMKELFITSTPEIVDQIFESFEGNEFEKMSGLAHKLKPSIDTFNIHSLKETIRKIEKFHTLGGSKEELVNWLSQLKTDSGLVIDDLKRSLEK
jgi:HPt (histidine-containing phosphotransfer) domain-containing protein